MLEGPLDFADIPGAVAHVYFFVLGVLDTQTHPLSLVPVRLPASLLLSEVEAALSYGNAKFLVVEKGAIKFEKVNQMLAKVYLISASLLIAPLQIVSHQHSQQKATNPAMVGLIELATLQEAFEDDEEWAEFGELNQQLSD